MSGCVSSRCLGKETSLLAAAFSRCCPSCLTKSVVAGKQSSSNTVGCGLAGRAEGREADEAKDEGPGSSEKPKKSESGRESKRSRSDKEKRRRHSRDRHRSRERSRDRDADRDRRHRER